METIQSWLTVSDDGTVSLPSELLTKYGLKSGDEVGVVETEGGLFVGTRKQIVDQLLDQMGATIREQYPDQSEDEVIQNLMERGRKKIRPRLLKELYDIDTVE